MKLIWRKFKPKVLQKGIVTDTIFATAGCETSDLLTGAVSPPIHFSTTFERDKETLELSRGFNYSRLSNPTRLQFENAMKKVEFGNEAFAFSSGMQAITSLFLACPKAHVLLPDDIYHGVNVLMQSVFSLWGMTSEKIDMTNHSAVAKSLELIKQNDPNKKIILWLETPSNPQGKVTDIETLSKLAKSIINEENICVAIDSTWATPYLSQPLILGADVVMHSTTKYIGGHSDTLGGILVTNNTIGGNSIIPILKTIHQIGGGVLSPWESWMTLRGMRTLPVRMKQHCLSALLIAKYLETHKLIEHVYYPGLINHPQHELATKQMNRMYGGMLSFRIKSKDNNAIEALKVSLIVYSIYFYVQFTFNDVYEVNNR